MVSERYVPLLSLGGSAQCLLHLAVLRGAEGYQRMVVLKQAHAADPQARETLAKEAHVAAALSHPNVVHVYELLETERGLTLAMEYLPGVSVYSLLAHLTSTGGDVPWAIAARIAADAARGLHHAHGARGTDGRPLGVVHRDVSPGNLLVTEDGITKVVDFGIARSALREVTRLAVVKGTPGYLSPEQARGEPLDYRSDLFALGAVLHEMLTGHPVFPGAATSTGSVLSQPIGPVPDTVPEVIGDLVGRMLARDATQRDMHMGEVADVLETASVGRGGSHRDVAMLLQAEFAAQLAHRRLRIRQLLSAMGPAQRASSFSHDTRTLLLLESALDEGTDPEDLDVAHPPLSEDGDTWLDLGEEPTDVELGDD